MKFPEVSRKQIRKARGHLAEILDTNLHTMQEDENSHEYSCAVISPENMR